MSCLFPVTGWYGKRNENGKRPVVFRRSDAHQERPYDEIQTQVPCGKCTGCAADKALMWSIRSYQEASLYPQNSFLTLTYDDNHCPDNLVKSHVQRFVRSLRDTGKTVRYFACGEYGDTTKRPHYHMCIFGTDFRCGSEVDINDQLYMVPEITEQWGKGHVSIAEFNMSTACYVAGYVAKKIGSEFADEFQLQSRKPAIGIPWLRKHYREILNTNSVVIEGRESPVPPQYIKWAEDHLDGALDPVKKARKERFKKMDIETVIDKHRERKAREVHINQKIQHQKTKVKL